MSSRILVTGAGGFLGHHLVRALEARGCWVRGVDLRNPACEESSAVEYLKLDLTNWDDCLTATEGIDYVFALAANTGRPPSAAVSRDNTLINAQCLEAARANKVRRFLYTSSSLVYPGGGPHTEQDAGTGDGAWDDLSMERLCHKYRKDFSLETRVARLHNVYGPLCAYEVYNEASPAGICRRIAEAHSGDTLELPGDGRQTFSHTYVDDCIEGLLRVMRSSCSTPLNIAAPEHVSLNELVRLTAQAAGKAIRVEHNLRTQPGSGRSLDIELSRQKLLWQPRVTLEAGIRRSYAWIEQELGYQGRLPRVRSAVA